MLVSSRRFILICAAVSSFGASAQQPAAPSRIRGDIVSVDTDSMKVRRNSGETVTVKLAPELQLSAVKNVPLAEVKSGAFVGIASAPGAGGKLRALEVLVLPDAARANAFHSEWDLQPGSTMTNANVDATVESTNGRELTLNYKTGTQVIVVPEGTPVVTFTSAVRTDLVPGRKVFVVARPADGGGFTTQRIVVEKDGVAPPM